MQDRINNGEHRDEKRPADDLKDTELIEYVLDVGSGPKRILSPGLRNKEDFKFFRREVVDEPLGD